VGYGDFVIENPNSLYFCTVYMVFAVITVSAAIGNLASLPSEMQLTRKKFEFEAKQLTFSMLEKMDPDGDGVDQFEFVLASLLAFGKVTRDDIEPIIQKFELLDDDGSGKLTADDLTAATHRAVEEQARRRAELAKLGFVGAGGIKRMDSSSNLANASDLKGGASNSALRKGFGGSASMPVRDKRRRASESDTRFALGFHPVESLLVV